MTPADEDLKAAKALCDAATPGPWGVYQHLPFDAMQVNHPAGNICELYTWQHRPDEREPDAHFIAASRTLVPKLIAEVERLRAVYNPLRVLSASEIQDALHQGRAEAMASQGDNAWSSLLRQRDEARAEVERLRADLARWEAVGERHDIKLREPGCKCHREEGDSPCPIHEGDE